MFIKTKKPTKQDALNALEDGGADALAKLCFSRYMTRGEVLEEYRDDAMTYEKAQGRETGCYYVLGSAYDKISKQPKTNYRRYREIRINGGMPHYTVTAKDALRRLKWENSIKAFRESVDAGDHFFIGEPHEYTDDKGYKYVFRVENEDDCYYMADDINHQGYTVDLCEDKPTFAEEGAEYSRHSGEGMQAYILHRTGYDTAPIFFDVPEDYLRQFYDGRQHSRGEAYYNMLLSAKKALKQDLDYHYGDFYVVSVSVYSPCGEELHADNLSGCDEKYAISGEAFLDHGFMRDCRDAIENHFAMNRPAFVAVNYEQGAFI